MAELIPNSFAAYELSDEEVLQGSIFTTLQSQVLQNHLASYAEEKLTLDFDPNKKDEFMQNEASLKAKIELLQYLKEASIASLDALTQRNTPNT